MKKTILILVCALVLIDGITSFVNLFNHGLFNVVNESTAYHIGNITGILFRIVVGAAGLFILLAKPKTKNSNLNF